MLDRALELASHDARGRRARPDRAHDPDAARRQHELPVRLRLPRGVRGLHGRRGDLPAADEPPRDHAGPGRDLELPAGARLGRRRQRWCSSPSPTSLDDPATAWFAPEIKSCMGYGAFYQGRLDDAHRWLVEAWEGYRARSADAASSPFWPLPHDAVPITAVALACVAALRGLHRGERDVGATGRSPPPRSSTSRPDRSARPSSPSTWPGSG